MSIDATRWAWQQSIRRSSLKLILLSMADRADEKHCCWPSIKRLQDDCGLDRKTVIKAIQDLEIAGLIKVDRTFGSSSHYQLIGVTNRHEKTGAESPKKVITNQSQKRDRYQNWDQSQKRDRTSPKNGTTTSPKNGTLNLPVEPTKNQPIKETCRVAKKSTSKPSPARATRLPSDWEIPDEYVQWAMLQTGLVKDYIKVMGECFKDYWIAKAGSSAMKVDWFATWRNWVRRDQQAGGKHENDRAILTSKRAAEWQRDVEMERWCNGES